MRNARPARALDSAEHAINLAPGNGDAWLYKGAALYGLKRHHEAIEAMRKAIALKPQRIESAWGWLADLYYELQLFPQAIAAYREALKEWTKDAAPYWHEIAQKNLDRANALLAKRRKG